VFDDEQTRRSVVEPLADLLADPRPRRAAARAELLSLGEVVFDTLTREISRE
jgi:hypothetical protein